MSKPQGYENTYDKAGSLRAPCLILLHGATGTRKQWLPQLDALSDQYRVLAPDLPGHGECAHERFTLDGAVSAIERLIRERAPLGDALVVGQSLGGYVATALAARAPQCVRGLMLAGSSINFTGAMGTLARMNGSLYGAFPKRWLAGLNARELRKRLPPALAEAQIEAGFFFGAAGDVFRALSGQDFHALLRGFPGPVLIANGSADAPNRRAEAAHAAAAQHAQVRVIANAGHVCNLEAPDAFNAALRDFAGQVFAT